LHCRITETPAETMLIRVSNSGVELAPEELPCLFDKFYRGSNATSTHPGIGLGLALIKRLTEHLGGTLKVESRQAETSFIVTLPMQVDSRTA
jgi:signal transduction histidine kinase